MFDLSVLRQCCQTLGQSWPLSNNFIVWWLSRPSALAGNSGRLFHSPGGVVRGRWTQLVWHLGRRRWAGSCRCGDEPRSRCGRPLSRPGCPPPSTTAKLPTSGSVHKSSLPLRADQSCSLGSVTVLGSSQRIHLRFRPSRRSNNYGKLCAVRKKRPSKIIRHC